MTDVLPVAAAYVVVLGGIVAYVVSLGRRLRGASRLSAALDAARSDGSPAIVSDSREPHPPAATGTSQSPQPANPLTRPGE